MNNTSINKSDSLLLTILDNTPFGIISFDDEGLISLANNQALAFLELDITIDKLKEKNIRESRGQFQITALAVSLAKGQALPFFPVIYAEAQLARHRLGQFHAHHAILGQALVDEPGVFANLNDKPRFVFMAANTNSLRLGESESLTWKKSSKDCEKRQTQGQR